MKTMETMFDLLRHARAWGERPALSRLTDGKKEVITFTRLCDDIERYARGYMELGLKKGDKVALFSSNTINWVALTLGMNVTGIVYVPRGENASAQDMDYILGHSGAKMVIVENEAVLKKLNGARRGKVKKVFSIDRTKGVPDTASIRELGSKSRKRLNPVSGGDLACIIYTSGTMGRPKGVMLSHYNIISNIRALHERVPVTPDDRAVSALPAWHIFEGVAKLFWLLAGTECFYSKIPDLPKTFEEQKPTMMPSVPRIWEAFYKRVIRNINKESAPKRAMVKGLLAIAVDHGRRRGAVDPLRLLEAPFHALLDRTAFAQLREKIGGRLRYALSGGGKLPHYLDDFFNAAGIEILEGYGLTETSPIVAARAPGAHELYTVGKPLSGVQVKVVDPETGAELSPGAEGLILVKGPNVMRGYYRDEEETRKTVVGGWLNTGDKGILSDTGRLAVSGRYKETIVLDNGENINPGLIEEELLKSPFISAAFIFDQDSKYLAALIVPNLEALKEHCARGGIEFHESDPAKALGQLDVRSLYKKEISKLVNRNPKFRAFESIRDFDLLPREFEIGREYTETLKLKRDVVRRLHGERISAMGKRGM
jgi:long-chain acyl-CoA synthetase